MSHGIYDKKPYPRKKRTPAGPKVEQALKLGRKGLSKDVMRGLLQRRRTYSGEREGWKGRRSEKGTVAGERLLISGKKRSGDHEKTLVEKKAPPKRAVRAELDGPLLGRSGPSSMRLWGGVGQSLPSTDASKRTVEQTSEGITKARGCDPKKSPHRGRGRANAQQDRRMQKLVEKRPPLKKSPAVLERDKGGISKKTS